MSKQPWCSWISVCVVSQVCFHVGIPAGPKSTFSFILFLGTSELRYKWPMYNYICIRNVQVEDRIHFFKNQMIKAVVVLQMLIFIRYSDQEFPVLFLLWLPLSLKEMFSWKFLSSFYSKL